MELGVIWGTVEKLKTGANSKLIFVYSGKKNGELDLVRLQELTDLGYPIVVDVGKICSRITRGVSRDLAYYGSRINKEIKQKSLLETIDSITKCCLALGVNGVLVNTHNDPAKSLSSAKSIMPLSKLGVLLEKFKKMKNIEKQLES
eukprot:TRINITY_DN475_c0_g1_i2.p2 TRINITY_DN475_c0_g1~~TRINITY_DN475_c0_g1_i2.p2  ORF type:complete len:146 (+),score=19.96 TRINITY_DN475_c0_g1_i2:348-785(+)